MELMRKPIHKFHGISVYEIKELGVTGFQYRYQIVSDNGMPITEKSSSLDYVMSIYQNQLKVDILQLQENDKTGNKITVKQ